MGESKSNQPLHYGQSVVEPDFGPCGGDDCVRCRSMGRDLCVFGCDNGWLPAPDGFSYRCVCNPASLEECDIAA